MSTTRALLALLEEGSAHGYELKARYDRVFRDDRRVAPGQVYSSLSRLVNSGLAERAGSAPGQGPDRKLYSITELGVADLDSWLATPEDPRGNITYTLHAKLVIALRRSKRDARAVLGTQRSEHLAALQQFERPERAGDVGAELIRAYTILHIRADLRWISTAEARLTKL